jgi:translation initiation factor 2 alpha subunit (eIF-2alpha)
LILSVDEKTMHVAFSLKRLQPNPWLVIERKYKPGDIVHARVSKILPYGAFAELEEGVEGLIHISTFKMNDKISDLNCLIQTGQYVTAEVLQSILKNIVWVWHWLKLTRAMVNSRKTQPREWYPEILRKQTALRTGTWLELC